MQNKYFLESLKLKQSSGEAESRLDDLIKSLQKGSADLLMTDDLANAKLSSFKQMHDAENIKGMKHLSKSSDLQNMFSAYIKSEF